MSDEEVSFFLILFIERERQAFLLLLLVRYVLFLPPFAPSLFFHFNHIGSISSEIR
jgi:hypothetical protein